MHYKQYTVFQLYNLKQKEEEEEEAENVLSVSVYCR